MSKIFKTLRDSERGAAAVEFALALPLFLSFILGLWQLGLVFWANAGVQHALGEGARYANIYPTPTDDEIKAYIVAREFGTHNGTLQDAVITTDSANGYKTIAISYSQPTDFIFFEGPTVAIDKSKRVYTAN
ncbi:TadE/TadG family type IV pilus assembly protein [Sphingomicrobium nitratireducens]|uniref:TadE/TadG family type IV pilus assembly protein n=1 Tax=Sphingomicrobium nitratireducens TaxID=2964666 RepID=UPI00223FA486|nr:TadE family protein [Sphingomicrobium nitratireducens]